VAFRPSLSTGLALTYYHTPGISMETKQLSLWLFGRYKKNVYKVGVGLEYKAADN